jgi:phosphoribosylamine-glycine ligase
MKEFLIRHSIRQQATGALPMLMLQHLSFARLVPVIKAGGLAAGKGVIIARSEQEAIDSVHCIRF